MTLTTEQVLAQDADAVAQRLLDATLGTVDLIALYLGDRLGWYRSLANDGPATPDELAERTGTSPRYAREWLEQQAVSGYVVVDVPQQRGPAVAVERRYRLPAGAAEVLTDPDSLSYLAPLGRMFAAPAAHLPELVEAYRTGGGVSWSQLGADARESQAEMNRPWYLQRLVPALREVPDLHERLAAPDARVAEIGCGGGWACIGLAQGYPDLTVEGFDIDGPSVELARVNVQNAGLIGRVDVNEADAASLPERRYDVVFALECVHDMPYPVEVLAAARGSLRKNGVVVVMDEAVGEEFAAPGDELERMMYGFSLAVCLPDGMSHAHSAGTGTVMRPATLRGYATEAGFSAVETLPVDDFGFWRFYRLVP